jgi:hypothetical protein
MTLVGLAALAGCQSKLESQVSGQVLLDSKPLERGTVTFFPMAQGTVSHGDVDANGKYTLSTGSNSGVLPGEYAVTVVATGPVPADYKPAELLTPQKYSSKETTDLKAVVKPGKNDIPLVLTSK